jgi:hypothetical protein
MNLLVELEKEFHCAGICKNPGYYVYSNVNNGIPEVTCFENLESRLNAEVLYLLAGATGITVMTTII